MLATGTVTDPLGASDVDAVTVNAGGAGGVRTIKSSWFATRINWGNSITETTQGPEATPDPYYHLAGPNTFGLPLTVIRDATSRGVRVYKMPAGTGTVVARLWSADGTVLASKSQVWTADEGGWREFLWDTPVELDADATYSWGYYYPTADTHYAMNTYVWNNGQDTCVYPLVLTGTGSWLKAGAGPTFTALSGDRTPHNYYIDPMVEWTSDVPGYSSGVGYYDQFTHGGSRFDFPIAVFWADPPYLAGYKALGVNTLLAGSLSEGYRDLLIAADMDWYPTLHGGDMSAPIAVQEDAELATRVRGYMLTDEPEFNRPFNSPAVLRGWRNSCRHIDSSRPILLNMSRITQENQGFVWQPTGISAKDVNLQWREYMSLVDMGSLDCYGIDHTYPFTYSGSDSARYGIWIYPLTIDRMRREVTDERMPIWGIVETTSAYPDSPTPDKVKKAVWSCLIAGAKGIEYFDHRFAGPAVGQDFAAMLNDAPMAAAVTALNAQIQNLSDALLAPEAGLVASCTSAEVMAAPLGGLPAGALIPVHATSRVVGGTTYFFVQTIRPGSTTVNISIPGFQGATLTVIDEGRTVTVGGDGTFNDDFDTDYAYHLYSTNAAPSFSAPANTVAPAITTDGSPETGETVSVSTGTWTGVPTPTYAYQWERQVAAVWSNIAGATSSSYVLDAADEGNTVRCTVTATNSQGSASAQSGTISPAAPAPSGYVDLILARPTLLTYWRLSDTTDESGNGYDLTDSTPTYTTDAASLITDPGDSSQHFDEFQPAYFSIADDPNLRLGQGSFSVELWTKPHYPSAGFHYVTKIGDFALGQGTGKFKFTALGAGGWYAGPRYSTTTLVADTVYQLVGTWDAATKVQKIYVNGVLEDTYDASGDGFSPSTSGWGPLRIGTPSGSIPSFGGTDGQCAGWLDEISLYTGVLSLADIQASYAAGTA